MVIIFPMAGKSQRFRDAGYSEPKYELPLAGQSVFRHAVAGFSHYFQSARFLFVHLEGAGAFVRSECIELGIKEFDLVEISLNTRGQAETVQLGLEAAGVAEREAIAIFNIDTFRPRFRLPPPTFLSSIDGYLEIFRGGGPNWSYVLPNPEQPGRALATYEKVEISDLCCTGLYYFKKAGDFKKCLSTVLNIESEAPTGEIYVAPLYNQLIKSGGRIGYKEIAKDDVIFCGIPAEYEALRQVWEKRDA